MGESMGNYTQELAFTIIVPYYKTIEKSDGMLAAEIAKMRERNCNILANRLKAQTLPRERYELIVVMDEWCEANDLINMADVKIIMPHRELFNKAWYFNRSARVAKADWLWFLDIDVQCDNVYLKHVSERATNKNKVYSGLTHYKREYRPGNWSEGPYQAHMILGYSTIIHKDKYWEKGGMCENFQGYGGEDGEMFTKHKDDVEYITATLEHPYHPTIDVHAPAYYHNVHLCEAVRCWLDEYLPRLIEIKDKLGHPTI